MLKIEKNVPFRGRAFAKNPDFELLDLAKKLEIGDSILFEANFDEFDSHNKADNKSTVFKRYILKTFGAESAKKRTEEKYCSDSKSIKKIGYRVWRLK